MIRHGSGRRHRLATLSVVCAVTLVLLALAVGLAPALLPDTLAGRDAQSVAAAAIFAASYLTLAVGRVPGLAIDRAGVALVGACLMVASGTLPLEDAYKAVDLDTLTLLLGMMIVVANLRLSGFFAQASAWVMRRAHHPLALLAAVMAVAGVFSAFLVNDAICLVLAPLVLELTLSLRRNPVPYLLAVAMASNIGSTATITGNPQNIMIGSFSQIPYVQFTSSLAPVALVGLVLTFILIRGRCAACCRALAGAHPSRADAACAHRDGSAGRVVLRRPAARQGSNHHRRTVAAHAACQERAHLCRN
jgi:di/tricarboxylate transporter